MEWIFFYRLLFYALGALGVALMALSAAQTVMEARLAQVEYANRLVPVGPNTHQGTNQGASTRGGSGEESRMQTELRK